MADFSLSLVRFRCLSGCLVLGLCLAGGAAARANSIAVFDTSLGTFQVDLYNNATPGTVQNFLTYLNAGEYNNSIIHRSVTVATAGVGVIQGGGFNTNFAQNTVNAAIPSEAIYPDVRGTIAMALSGNSSTGKTDPNSGTDQWFVNTTDNTVLDTAANGPFTVFGRVINGGMTVVDAIAAEPVFAFQSPFGQIPLRNYTQTDYNAGTIPSGTNNAIVVNSITIVGTYQPVWQNPTNRFEVTGHSFVSPLDAAWIVDNLLASGAHLLPTTMNGQVFYDVNGDDYLSKEDAAAVINSLNSAGPMALLNAQPALALHATAVPEPATGLLAALGAASLAALAWRRSRSRRAASAA